MIEQLVDALKTSVDGVKVTFTKVDGAETTRLMTLHPSLLPVIEKKTDKTKAPNPDIIAAYSLDDKGWRSFRKENLVRYEAP